MFDIRQQIKNENKLIAAYFDQQVNKIQEYKNKLLEFNQKISTALQSYSVLARKEFNDLFTNSFKKIDFEKLNQLEDKQKLIDDQVTKIKDNISKNLKVVYVEIGQVDNCIDFQS